MCEFFVNERGVSMPCTWSSLSGSENYAREVFGDVGLRSCLTRRQWFEVWRFRYLSDIVVLVLCNPWIESCFQ